MFGGVLCVCHVFFNILFVVWSVHYNLCYIFFFFCIITTSTMVGIQFTYFFLLTLVIPPFIHQRRHPVNLKSLRTSLANGVRGLEPGGD